MTQRIQQKLRKARLKKERNTPERIANIKEEIIKKDNKIEILQMTFETLSEQYSDLRGWPIYKDARTGLGKRITNCEQEIKRLRREKMALENQLRQ